DAIKTVRDELIPLATVVTPNLPEAERLTGQAITSNQAMVTAGHALQGLGADNVIIKGGHGDNPDLANDFVLLADGTAPTATGSMHVDWWSFLIGVTVNEEENCYGITIIEYFTGSQSDCF
ncbi:hypothetical protein WP50_32535, partial [Lactiplantibacillus plantarum]